MVFFVGPLDAAEKLPKDPSNQTNLYYVIKRLKEQQRAAHTRRQATADRYKTGYQKIYRKLAQIRFDEVIFDGMTLDEVVNYLSEEIRKKDPLKKGINFMFVSPIAAPGQLAGAPAVGGAPPGAPALVGRALGGQQPGQNAALGADPNAVLAVAPVITAGPDLENVLINLRQPLRGLSGLQVLDVVVKTADQPIMFSVSDYAITVLPRAPGSPNVAFRTLRVDPDTFQQGMPNFTQPFIPVIGNQGQGGRGGQGGGGRQGGGN